MNTDEGTSAHLGMMGVDGRFIKVDTNNTVGKNTKVTAQMMTTPHK